MMHAGSPQHQQATGIKHQPGNQQSDQQHGQNSQQQQQQLLEHNPTAIEFFAFQQEFHRGKSHLLVSQPAENMNQNRHQHQRSPRQHVGWVEEELGEGRHGGIFSIQD